MKKYLLAMTLLFLLVPVSGQTELGVSDGDSFTFDLVRWAVSYDSTSSSVVTLEDEFSSGSLTMRAGDSFTITIVNATIIKDTDGDQQLEVEYSANGQTIRYLEWVDWGGFIVVPDWDSYRDEFNSELSTQTTESDGSFSTMTLIDTDTEFGIKEEFSYKYSGSDYSYSSTGASEIRYEKSTGVLTKTKLSSSSNDVSSGVTTHDNFDVEVVRSGFDSGDTSGGVSLPGFEFLWVSSLLLFPIIRKFK